MHASSQARSSPQQEQCRSNNNLKERCINGARDAPEITLDIDRRQPSLANLEFATHPAGGPRAQKPVEKKKLHRQDRGGINASAPQMKHKMQACL